MKQEPKNNVDMLNWMNKIQEQLSELNKKMDNIIHQSLREPKLPSKPIIHNTPSQANPQSDRNKGRPMYTAICADCKKECNIPFKPSGERPVYCKDCFSRRKVISLSGIKMEEKPKEIAPIPIPVIKEISTASASVKTKKKAVSPKKPVAKKKAVVKKSKKK